MVRGHETEWHHRRNSAGQQIQPSEEPRPRFIFANEGGSSSSRRSHRRSSQMPPPPPPHQPRVPQPLDLLTAGDVYAHMSQMLARQHAQEEGLRNIQLELRHIHHAVANLAGTLMEILGILQPDLPDEVMNDDPNEPRWRP